MPELPEVETIVRDLRPKLVGRTITGVSHADWPNTVAPLDPAVFRATVVGETILEVTRRAKYILLQLSSDRVLAVHLRMTGALTYVPTPQPAGKTTRLIFKLDNGAELHFTDARKFGKVRLLSPDEVPAFLDSLGPEPLPDDFTLDRFRGLLAGRRAQLKPLLLNQRVLAGLGNIYADEALFLARIHPQRLASSLTEEETARLYHAIRQVLTQGIANRGTTISDYRDASGEKGNNQEALNAYGQRDQPCPRCGTPIVRLVVGGRGTHICPQCQELVISDQRSVVSD
jgi:formamidopyrimidine-DNA glycosylase